MGASRLQPDQAIRRNELNPVHIGRPRAAAHFVEGRRYLPFLPWVEEHSARPPVTDYLSGGAVWAGFVNSRTLASARAFTDAPVRS